MANSYAIFPPSAAQASGRTYNVYIIADTDAGKPVSGLVEGDKCWAKDTNKLYVALTATTWQEIGSGGTPVVAGLMNGRIERTDATNIKLARYNGDIVEVGGENVALGSGGISVATTSNLIASDGTDAGAAMGASTLYYLYLSNSGASYAASSLRGSTTAPTRVNGVYYLGSGANAAKWRFIGWCKTNGSTNFVDSLSQRWIVNYYNRLRVPWKLTPGYSDGNTNTTYSLNAGSNWTVLNGGTGAVFDFISNGEDAVEGHMIVVGSDQSGTGMFGLGLDGSDPSDHGGGSALYGVSGLPSQPSPRHEVLSAGAHTYSMYGATGGGSFPITFYADLGANRAGGAKDTPLTRAEGTVMA